MQPLQAATRSSRTPRLILAVGLAAIIGLGCERRLTIRQDGYINNAMHHARPEARRTGEPLELTVVLVLPDDTKKPENEVLRPDNPVIVTAKDWYDRRPGSPAQRPLSIPEDQIFLFTDSPNPHGLVVGSALHGHAFQDDFTLTLNIVAGSDNFVQLDAGPKIPLKQVTRFLDLKGNPLDSKDCALYIFGRFADESGDMLPVKAVMIRPKEMKENGEIRVGVDKELYKSNPGQAQYIKAVP
jgi:hypothetical protein